MRSMSYSSASNGHARVKPACVSKLSEFLTERDVCARLDLESFHCFGKPL